MFNVKKYDKKSELQQAGLKKIIKVKQTRIRLSQEHLLFCVSVNPAKSAYEETGKINN